MLKVSSINSDNSSRAPSTSFRFQLARFVVQKVDVSFIIILLSMMRNHLGLSMLPSYQILASTRPIVAHINWSATSKQISSFLILSLLVAKMIFSLLVKKNFNHFFSLLVITKIYYKSLSSLEFSSSSLISKDFRTINFLFSFSSFYMNFPSSHTLIGSK